MNLIETNTPTPVSTAKRTADRLIHHANATLLARVDDHKKGYRAFWESKDTPDSILVELGAHAQTFLAAASENVEHIGRLAALRGAVVTDFLPESYWVPKRGFIAGENGTLTLEAPKFGHDAWNRFVPVPEDPQRTGYDEQDNPTYGKYADGTWIMSPLPDGAVGYTDDKQLIWGYDEQENPILVQP